MTRAAAGFAGIHLVFMAVGMALLYALGFVSRPRQLAPALGPAYLAGLAALMPVLILLLLLGVPIRLPAVVAVGAAGTATLAVAGLIRARGRPAAAVGVVPPSTPAGRWMTRGLFIVLGAYFAIGASAFAKLPTVNDDWAFWSYKASVLYHYGGQLQHQVFTGAFPGTPHLDYPLLQPLLESIFFRAMGGVHLQEWHIALWIMFASFVWSVGFLFRARGVPVLILAGPLAALALSPLAARWVAIGYADVSQASFAATGALCAGLWLDGGATRYALLAGVLFAGAANTKNEGMTTTVIVLLAAAVVLLLSRSRRWRAWIGAAAIAGAGTLPWIVWRSSHGLGNDDVPPLAQALDAHTLVDRLGRLSHANGGLFAQLADQGGWLWIVPCFLVLAVVCVATRTARRQAGFYLAATAAMMLALLWVYWTGRIEIHYWIKYSADRVVTGVVFVAGVGLIHLLAIALDAAPTASPEAPRFRRVLRSR